MNSSQVFEVAVSLPLQVLIVVLVTSILDIWQPSAKTSCHLWTVCFVSVLGLVGSAFLLPHLRLMSSEGLLATSAMRTAYLWQATAIQVIAVAWLAGLVAVVTSRVLRCWHLRVFVRQHCAEMNGRTIADLPLKEGDVVPGNIRWLVSDRGNGPFCWQVHRPTVVVPLNLISDADPVVVRHVLMHELEHLRTHHPIQHFLQGVCGALFWFHPAVQWAARRAELCREFLCDEVAAKSGGSVASYLQTLATVAEQNARAPSCTLAFGRRKSAIVRRSERLVRINEESSPEHTGSPRLATIGLVVLTLLVSQVWLPVNVLASQRSLVSPWPKWSAETLHDFGVTVRDYEPFDFRHDLHDLLQSPP